ncbi:MAG: M3 family metallopeptidase [Candidatus Zixiibacteriota bacterium]|nr:MAG: M3 family metallopeptidase [candidate division Zixibacteria bacterium]
MRQPSSVCILSPTTVNREDFTLIVRTVLSRLTPALLLAVLSVPVAAQDNPLLSTPSTPYQTPPFELIQIGHYLPAVQEAIRQDQAEIDSIVNNPEAATFDNTVAALDLTGQLLDNVVSVFYSLLGTVTSPEMQDLANEISPLLSAHNDNIWLNEMLFARVKAVYDQRASLTLSEDQLYLLENIYREFVRRGALLDKEQKARLRDINREHDLLVLKFDENLLAETNNSYIIIDNEDDLAGLPDGVIAMGEETANAMELPGKWVFTTQRSSFTPFLQHADARDLRQALLTAYSMRGDRDNEFDNKAILKEMFTLRQERSRMLGYPTPAAFYMQVRMAGTPEAVDSFLRRLWEPALRRAGAELIEMQAIMDNEQSGSKLQPWDWWYFAEKLRKTKYELDDAELRPYFELENVQTGVFVLAEKLFGLKLVERDDIPIYHPEVRVFEVREADGSLLGILYVDYFFRNSKYGGAWSGGFRGAFLKDGKRVIPLATLVCNFPAPSSSMPSLLSFDEVKTLFHEFGHALNTILYSGTYRNGFYPLDAVELPSQIIENWALEPQLLNLYARHYLTDSTIPATLIDRINNSYLFNKGFEAVEYLAASFLDMAWHGLDNVENVNVNDFEAKTMAGIGLIPEILPRYRSTYFSHIHGGYRAGYYSYYWSGVLDADAFAAFKETSLFDRETAASFRKNILEKLGTADSMTLYKRFRGREPEVEPFLERGGLQ